MSVNLLFSLIVTLCSVAIIKFFICVTKTSQGGGGAAGGTLPIKVEIGSKTL